MQMKNRIQAIRDQIDRAHNAPDTMQSGQILIALSQIADLIEEMQTPAVPDRYAAARHEYQAERRNDEWAAYHTQEHGQEGE